MLEDFISKTETDNTNIIYGAGYAGRVIRNFLMNRGMPVAAYAVTELKEKMESDGLPVYALDELLRLYDAAGINFIIGASGGSRASIKKELSGRGISSCLEVTEELICRMARENRKTAARQAEKNKERKMGRTIGYLQPGYLDTDYAERRLIAGKIKGASYAAVPKEAAELPEGGMPHEGGMEACRHLEEACYRPCEYAPDVDLMHTFNAVCDTDIPWCASFETTLPRMWPKTEEEERHYLKLVELMKRPNCRRLYALCGNALGIQRQSLLRHVPPEDAELLMAKTKVLHPPQEVLVSEDEFERKHAARKFHFIFIGNAFFIKGGREMIRALSKFEGRHEFKLTLISSLAHNDYLTRAPHEESLRWREIIRGKGWIEHLERLENGEVLEKCREATIGMLPSFADTYGYAVLEMQAAGCPAVTTNVRAFPEINNEECGWACRLPVDGMGFCCGADGAARSGILQQELERCLGEIFGHPEEIRRKGKAALERIGRMHDPEAYAAELEKDLF